MRGVAVSLWLSAITAVIALYVGDLIAKRITAMLIQTAMIFRW